MITVDAPSLSEKIGPSLVRYYFAAYVARDRKALDALLAADFTFTSPLDDHIGQAEYFAQCWPECKKVDAFHLEQVVAEGDEVFVLYLCEQMDGTTYRNTEHFKIEGRKIKSVEVYFGQAMPAGAGSVEQVASRE